MITLLHAAQFDFESHEHDGQVCEIYLHEKNSGCADVPGGAVLPDVALVDIKDFRFKSYPLVLEIRNWAPPRAPPASFLS